MLSRVPEDRKYWKAKTEVISSADSFFSSHDIRKSVAFFPPRPTDFVWWDHDQQWAHLGRESRGFPAGTGLSAAGVDLAREHGWCPGGTGDRGVSGASVSAAPPLSKNTSLGPMEPVAVGPGDVTMEGRTGLNTPGRLEDEPLPAGKVSVTCWVPAPSLGCSTAAPPSLSPSRASSAAFWSSFTLSWQRGRPSREMLLRNSRAACLLRESFTFLRGSLAVLVGLLSLPLDCKPHRAVAILVWKTDAKRTPVS